MKYEEKFFGDTFGTVRSGIVGKGHIRLIVVPGYADIGYSNWYYMSMAHTGEFTTLWDISVARDVHAKLGQAIAEYDRQTNTEAPVTDGNGMEAIVPPNSDL